MNLNDGIVKVLIIISILSFGYGSVLFYNWVFVPKMQKKQVFNIKKDLLNFVSFETKQENNNENS